MQEIIQERCRQHSFNIEQAQFVANSHHPLDREAIQARRDILNYSIQLAECLTILQAISLTATAKT